jgi:hypothetical protein
MLVPVFLTRAFVRIGEPTVSRRDCHPAEILPRRRISPWLTKKWVGSSKAANRVVSKAANRVVSRNQVSKLRHLEKAVSKAVAANKVDNKAVSRAHKIVKLSFALSQKRIPRCFAGGFLLCC